ncbi:hypothetical protein [Kitasatospora sp. NBC_00458]|uniref:hypothetical protein n=1 Tax=Kitasatospora sp. NBC_00458 TaxID=2903568 RepID=UPI002E172CF3
MAPARLPDHDVSRLAVEANVKRWHLPHQHSDQKDHFQAETAKAEARRSSHVRSADAFEEPKEGHAALQAHCQQPEARLQTCANALDPLALENAALSGRDADAAKVRALPRRSPHLS